MDLVQDYRMLSPPSDPVLLMIPLSVTFYMF